MCVDMKQSSLHLSVLRIQGVPKDATTEETIRICLSEIDRCYDDNTAPFFLNLAG